MMTLKPCSSHEEISIKIDDELYRRASQRASNLEAEGNEHMMEYLESINGDDESIRAARGHMAELFKATRNFGVGIRPSREEMHERERSPNSYKGSTGP